MRRSRGTTGETTFLALALSAALPALAASPRPSAARPPANASRSETVRPPAGRPDAALYQEARQAEAALRAERKLMAQRTEWEKVVLRYRKLVARYPRSGYCDNALLAVGDLYREMATRFKGAPYRDDAVEAYRRLVAEYPSSSLGDDALFDVVQIVREEGDRRHIAEAANAYLEANPEGRRAREVKALLRKRAPTAPVPSPPPPGLARVFDLRAWSGDSSTRVVIDLERKVKLTYDRIASPDRLWVDLEGTRLHPNLTARSFPVADGLLEQIRIAQNKDDVVRVVLDFKDVRDHSVFYLDPTRLVIDVRGESRPGPAVADASRPVAAVSMADASAAERTAEKAAEKASDKPVEKTQEKVADRATDKTTDKPADKTADKPLDKAPEKAPEKTAIVDTIPTRRLNGMLPPEPPPVPLPLRTPAPILLQGVARTREPEPAERNTREASSARRKFPTAPEPPDVNRAGSYSLARQLGLGARRIVIDAGHGGHDPGTIGRGGLQEKDLVLDVATRLERMVRAELGAEVIMTRSTDVFVPLEERTAIANSRGADLFLSVHANASRNPTARGIETYFLNFAQDPHAEAVAARENAISPATLKDLQQLVKAITLNSKIDESRDFATSVQEAMVESQKPHHPVEDRGVHTAPFYVLIGANMPSVLAEIAFVSNPEDEKRLKAQDARELIARSLLRGVRGYLESLNRTQTRQLTGSHTRSTVATGERGR